MGSYCNVCRMADPTDLLQGLTDDDDDDDDGDD